MNCERIPRVRTNKFIFIANSFHSETNHDKPSFCICKKINTYVQTVLMNVLVQARPSHEIFTKFPFLV